MGSEPNIYNTKLARINSADAPHSSMKSHNSDSEILRLATERRPDEIETEKVIFTLGDDTCLRKEMLVKLSSNNDDHEKVDEVKRICSEIKDFCTDKDEEGFDVVKHMEAINVNIDIAKYMEEKRTSVVDCENCASDVCDVPCANNVTDVIVIPSAEAILDTGQNSGQGENVDVAELQ